MSLIDDTRVLLAITNEKDVKTLQSDLKTIYLWQQIKNIQFMKTSLNYSNMVKIST